MFIVTKDGLLVTPSRNILKGITRGRVIGLAQGIIDIEERDISLDELSAAREVFLTSTTKKIMPVLKIDDRVVGDRPGNFTRLLYDRFNELEKSIVGSAGRRFEARQT